jgi:hypothetical protein
MLLLLLPYSMKHRIGPHTCGHGTTAPDSDIAIACGIKGRTTIAFMKHYAVLPGAGSDTVNSSGLVYRQLASKGKHSP